MDKYERAFNKLRASRPRVTKHLSKSAVKKIAQNVINKQVEYKRRLDYLSGVTLTSQSAGHVLFDGPQIAVGDGAENRDGLQVQLKSLKMKLLFDYKGVPTKVRLIGVRYPQGSESPSLSQILTHPTDTQCMISPWLKAGPVKYSVFCNKIINLGGEADMASTYKEKYVDIKVKLPKSGQRITYESGTQQTPDKNRYTLFAITNFTPAIAGDRAHVSLFTQTGFTDM